MKVVDLEAFIEASHAVAPGSRRTCRWRGVRLRRPAPVEVPGELRVFTPVDWHPERDVAVMRWQKARHDWLEAHPEAEVLEFLRAELAEPRRVICTDL